jgi:DNA-directed RNA polymerase subunit L
VKLKKLKKDVGELKVEVESIGHTMCNLLQQNLLKDENVTLAGYDVPHPLASNSIIFVRTKGNVKPQKILLKAIKETRKLNKQFSKKFEETIKKI